MFKQCLIYFEGKNSGLKNHQLIELSTDLNFRHFFIFPLSFAAIWPHYSAVEYTSYKIPFFAKSEVLIIFRMERNRGGGNVKNLDQIYERHEY